MRRRNLLTIALVLAAAGIIAALLVYKYVYNKPHTDYINIKPDFELTPAQLHSAFIESSTNEYLGKVILVKGQPDKIETVDSLTVAVYVISEGMFGDEGLRCTLHKDFAAKGNQFDPSSIKAVKGYCTGFNDPDVILEQCTFISE